jgi:hypothetical protein
MSKEIKSVYFNAEKKYKRMQGKDQEHCAQSSS